MSKRPSQDPRPHTLMTALAPPSMSSLATPVLAVSPRSMSRLSVPLRVRDRPTPRIDPNPTSAFLLAGAGSLAFVYAPMVLADDGGPFPGIGPRRKKMEAGGCDNTQKVWCDVSELEE